MIIFVLDRNMNTIGTMSSDLINGLLFSDISGGQTIELVDGCFVGSYKFTVLRSETTSQKCQPGNYITFKDKYGVQRLYTIISINGTDELTISCEDGGMELLNVDAPSFNKELKKLSFDEYLKYSLEGSGWRYVLNPGKGMSNILYTKRAFDYDSETVLKRLENIALDWGVEIDFSAKFNGSKISERVATITASSDVDMTIKHRFYTGIDIVESTVEKSIKDLYTAVYVEPSTDAEKDEIKNYEYDDGRFKSPKGLNYIYDTKAAEEWHRPNTSPNNKTYITAIVKPSGSDISEIFNNALKDLKAHSTPTFTYGIKVANSNVKIGDYVQISDTDAADSYFMQARVTSVTNHISDPDNDTIELTNYVPLKSRPLTSMQRIIAEVSKNTKSLDHRVVEYAISTSGAEPPTDGWTDIDHLPEIKGGEYQWTRITDHFTDGSSSVMYGISKSEAVKLPKIVNTQNWYQLGQNGSDIPNGEWLEARPETTTDKSYVWTKTLVTYDNDDTVLSYSVVKDGIQGTNGKGVKKIFTQYYVSSSAEEPKDSEWVDSIPRLQPRTYIWQRTKTVYTDDTEFVSDPTLASDIMDLYERIISTESSVNTSMDRIELTVKETEKIKDSVSDAQSNLRNQLDTLKSQLNLSADKINSFIEEYSSDGLSKKMQSILDINGLHIGDPSKGESIINEEGMAVTNSNGEVIAKFTNNNSEVNYLNIREHLSVGAHRYEVLNQPLEITNFSMGKIERETLDGTAIFWIGDVK